MEDADKPMPSVAVVLIYQNQEQEQVSSEASDDVENKHPVDDDPSTQPLQFTGVQTTLESLEPVAASLGLVQNASVAIMPISPPPTHAHAAQQQRAPAATSRPTSSSTRPASSRSIYR